MLALFIHNKFSYAELHGDPSNSISFYPC